MEVVVPIYSKKFEMHWVPASVIVLLAAVKWVESTAMYKSVDRDVQWLIYKMREHKRKLEDGERDVP